MTPSSFPGQGLEPSSDCDEVPGVSDLPLNTPEFRALGQERKSKKSSQPLAQNVSQGCFLVQEEEGHLSLSAACLLIPGQAENRNREVALAA